MKSKLVYSPNDFDHRKGSLKARVVLVEFGGLQCSPCKKINVVIDQLKNFFGDDLCTIYRHFPLKNIHRSAEYAALASEAAGLQGQFWPMHHLLFKNAESLTVDLINSLANSLNLDQIQFQKDLKLPHLAAKIKKDFEGGIRSGVNGTPSIYLNGSRYRGLHMFEMLKEEIESLRKPKGLFSLFA